jgi:HK97 gp10 family phage protein
MASGLKWFGARVEAEIKTGMKRRLLKAGGIVRDHAQDLINTSGTGRYTKSGLGSEGGKLTIRRKGAKRLNVAASKPGDPPFKQKGDLKKSLKVRPIDVGARVFSKDPKAHLLELGTRKMAARPFLKRALAEKRGDVKRTIERPLTSGRG